MPERLLLCTDLDRTLIPNGPQPESPPARARFTELAARPEVTLAYVSGRHRALVEQAINNYRLPMPDFVVADVGSTLYRVDAEGEWHRESAWEQEIAPDWAGHSQAALKQLLAGVPFLRPQEPAKQNRYKLSYYVPLHADQESLSEQIRQRLEPLDVRASLVWSVDEPQGIGLLDILPARATKLHAVQALMRMGDFDTANTVFSGDSGNDLAVLASEVPAVLVANSQDEVRHQARQLAEQEGHGDSLYIAHGRFMSLNGNYSSGILEGVAHYHPDTLAWMGFSAVQEAAHE